MGQGRVLINQEERRKNYKDSTNLLNLKMTYQWKSMGRNVTTREKGTLKL